MQLIDQWGGPLLSANCDTGAGNLSGYEGAQDTGVRDSFLAFPVNSRKELNHTTRRELQRKQRALAANLPLFERINSKIAQHAVGKGIFVRPLTKDREWNQLNRKRYENRVSNPYTYSIDASCDLYEDQRFAAGAYPGDGEFFEAFVREQGGIPLVQRLDPFEIENPLGATIAQGRWQDGVLTDGYDRPLSYGVRELPLPGVYRAQTFRPLPADSMIHIFRRRRAHQTRGIPWAFTGINDGIDALDLKALIKGKAKLHSALAIAVRKKKSEAGANGIADQLKKSFGADGQLTRVDENFWRGAAIQYLATDEGIDLLSSDCPSDNLLGFIEMLYREIAIGYGIPLEVVYNLAALGGATARAVLEDAQWLFDMVMDTIVMRHSRRHYIWETANAVQSGDIRPCRDPEWWAAAYRGPAKLTVDMGRSADAAIKLIKNGALSHVRYFEERAQDAYEEAQEQIDFLAWLKAQCAAAGLAITDLIEPTPGAVTNVSVHTPENDK